MALTKKKLEETYDVTLEKAKMLIKAENKEITGWVAKANDNCFFGNAGDIVAFGAILQEIDDELSQKKIGFKLNIE